MDVRQATLEQLSDASKITKVEAAAIFKVHPRLQECRHSALDQIAQTTPTFVPILANEYSKNDLLLVDLIQRKISWGEELKRARELVADATAELMQEGERIDAGLEQSHEAELARRQAAFNALSQYAQTQQIINNMNRPVVTNCNTFGNSTNCVTH